MLLKTGIKQLVKVNCIDVMFRHDMFVFRPDITIFPYLPIFLFLEVV